VSEINTIDAEGIKEALIGIEQKTRLSVACDGAVQDNGNCGRGGFAFYNGDVVKIKGIASRKGSGGVTNNEAEYMAIIALLSDLQEMGMKDAPIDLYCDSQLVIHQIMGLFKVNAQNLKSLHAKAAGLASCFSDLKLHRVPRTTPIVMLVDHYSKFGVDWKGPIIVVKNPYEYYEFTDLMSPNETPIISEGDGANG
jgi:ribonuclease HI